MKAVALNRSLDPFGFDIFESVEAFEDIVGSLTSLYMRLYYQEMDKEAPNKPQADLYMKRLRDIRESKNKFAVGDVSGRNKLFQEYLAEYKKMNTVNANQ